MVGYIDGWLEVEGIPLGVMLGASDSEGRSLGLRLGTTEVEGKPEGRWLGFQLGEADGADERLLGIHVCGRMGLIVVGAEEGDHQFGEGLLLEALDDFPLLDFEACDEDEVVAHRLDDLLGFEVRGDELPVQLDDFPLLDFEARDKVLDAHP